MDMFWLKPESRRLELKETLPVRDKIVNTAIAFSNGAGGKIVIGVKDKPRLVVGVPDEQLFEWEEKISNWLAELCRPMIIPEIYIQSVEDKNLLIIEIFPGRRKPYHLVSKGRPKGTYIRVGSTNRVAGDDMIGELERQSRGICFDTMAVYDVDFNDISMEQIKAVLAKATGRNIDKEVLKNIGLLVEERNQLFVTHAGILFSDFADIREKVLPMAKVECARFKGTTTSVFIDQKSVSGSPCDIVEEVMKFVKRNIALGATIGELYRENRWEYPLKAIREALINAIVHRDYSIMGSDVKVAIFDDMLEITSPGVLPDTLSVDNLESGRSELRNRSIARVFKELSLIEAWGTGFKKMREELKDYPEIKLEAEEVDFCFQVRFILKEVTAPVYEARDEHAEYKVSKAKSGQMKFIPNKKRNSSEEIVELLIKYPRITIAALAEDVGLTTRGIEKQLKKLKEQGRIERVGARKNGFWQVNK